MLFVFCEYDAVFYELCVEVFLHHPEFGFNYITVEPQILKKLLSQIKSFLFWEFRILMLLRSK